ncbi:MAG: hypothetical protein WBB19_16365 [Desulforhopalus sp.]
MAEKKKKDDVEVERASAKKNERSGAKKKFYNIIVAVVLILLLGGGFVTWFFLKEKPVPEEVKDPGQQVPMPAIGQQSQIGPMVNIEEFIGNIISGDAAHYVKASITVELTKEAVKIEVGCV